MSHSGSLLVVSLQALDTPVTVSAVMRLTVRRLHQNRRPQGEKNVRVNCDEMQYRSPPDAETDPICLRGSSVLPVFFC